MGISRNRYPARRTSSFNSSENAMPSWTRRSRGRIDRRNAHMPDWESRIEAPYRRRNARFRISFPTRCIPDIASAASPVIRSPDTKSARSSASGRRRSGNRFAGYVESASSVPRYVPRVSEERGAEPQQGPERGLLPQHPSGAVPAPEDAVLQRELLPPGSVPHRLPKKVVHGIAGPMVHDRARTERDRMARPHRADVQVDVLRGHKPFVKAADFVEHSFAVGEVRRWIRNVSAFDDQLDAFEFFERSVANLNRATRDDVVSMEALH